MFNILKVRPTIGYLNPAPFEIIGKYIYNWPHFSLEMLRKRTSSSMQANWTKLCARDSTKQLRTCWWSL